MKIDEIEKHDQTVRKSYPNAQMLKQTEDLLIWFDDYGRIAILTNFEGRVKFQWLRK
jgi:hypothetical protein